MPWVELQSRRLTRPERKSLLRQASFYADHNVSRVIVAVLRRVGYDVETAKDVQAEAQPDHFHYRRAFKSKRVLLTQDKGFLNETRFPLSQSRGVIILNIDMADELRTARALIVIEDLLGRIAPSLRETKVVLNGDYTFKFLGRLAMEGQYTQQGARCRFDREGRQLLTWHDESCAG